MPGVNKVILVGNCGQDPETRYTNNGATVTSLSIATSEAWNDKNTGERHEKTEWHKVVFFGRIAEVVGKYAQKGSKLYIEGKLETQQWEKDGVKRYTTQVIAQRMELLDSRGQQNDSQSHHSTPFQQKQTRENDFDDDIPF